jgi:hypothetical protein
MSTVEAKRPHAFAYRPYDLFSLSLRPVILIACIKSIGKNYTR